MAREHTVTVDVTIDHGDLSLLKDDRVLAIAKTLMDLDGGRLKIQAECEVVGEDRSEESPYPAHLLNVTFYRCYSISRNTLWDPTQGERRVWDAFLDTAEGERRVEETAVTMLSRRQKAA